VTGLIRSVDVFSARRSVNLGAQPIVIELDAKLDPVAAHFSIPVAALGEPGESVKSVLRRIGAVTIGEPWGNGEPAKLEPSFEGDSIEVSVAVRSSGAWNKMRPQFALQWKSGTRELMQVESTKIAADDTANERDRLESNIESSKRMLAFDSSRLAEYERVAADPSLVDDVITSDKLAEVEAENATLTVAVADRTATVDKAWNAASISEQIGINAHIWGWASAELGDVKEEMSSLALTAFAGQIGLDNAQDDGHRAKMTKQRDEATAALEALIDEHGLHGQRLAFAETKLGLPQEGDSLRSLRVRLSSNEYFAASLEEHLDDRQENYLEKLPQRLSKTRASVAERQALIDGWQAELADPERSIRVMDSNYVA